MFHLDTVTSTNDNKNWPYRMLIVGPSGKINQEKLMHYLI